MTTPVYDGSSTTSGGENMARALSMLMLSAFSLFGPSNAEICDVSDAVWRIDSAFVRFRKVEGVVSHDLVDFSIIHDFTRNHSLEIFDETGEKRVCDGHYQRYFLMFCENSVRCLTTSTNECADFRYEKIRHSSDTVIVRWRHKRDTLELDRNERRLMFTRSRDLRVMHKQRTMYYSRVSEAEANDVRKRFKKCRKLRNAGLDFFYTGEIDTR